MAESLSPVTSQGTGVRASMCFSVLKCHVLTILLVVTFIPLFVSFVFIMKSYVFRNYLHGIIVLHCNRTWSCNFRQKTTNLAHNTTAILVCSLKKTTHVGMWRQRITIKICYKKRAKSGLSSFVYGKKWSLINSQKRNVKKKLQCGGGTKN